MIFTWAFFIGVVIILLIVLLVAKSRRKKNFSSKKKSEHEPENEKVEFSMEEPGKSDLPS